MSYKRSKPRKKSHVEIMRMRYGYSYCLDSMDEDREDFVPEVGKTYHFFDDGKIGLSRHYLATVEKIVPMKYVRKKLRGLYRAWEQESIETYWLYAMKSDYAVKCSIKKFDVLPVWFFRTKSGGWFSIDYPMFWMGGKLDVDGTYFTASLEAHKNNLNALEILEKSEETRKHLNGET